jgi:hypothetical protein
MLKQSGQKLLTNPTLRSKNWRYSMRIMKIYNAVALVLIFFCVGQGLAQVIRQDAGTKLLIPSSARTGSFTSFLAVVNLDGVPNSIRITSLNTDGIPTGTLTTSLQGFARFRSADILRDLGAPVGSFGPIIVESINGVLLTAVSEVSSSQGPGGFFPGINVDTAWYEGRLAEVIDTGDMGASGTFRTNIGVNNVSTRSATVTINILGIVGATNSISITIPPNGMIQINNVIRSLLASGSVTGRNGYLRFVSTEPIIAWASKIENGTGDPSFQIGIAARLDVQPPPPISLPAIADIALAGQPDGATNIRDSAPLNSPFLALSNVRPGQAINFDASGSVRSSSFASATTPDGNVPNPADTSRVFGISSITGPSGALIGVFLGLATPNANTFPPPADYTGSGRDLTILRPLLHQPFYIGTGKTSSGITKSIIAPSGASRLFLAVLDQGGFSNDNSGFFTVNVSTQ